MSQPLSGIVVLDLSTGGAGALASMFLSDLGARVIRATGPAAPLFRDGGFVVWDRGKEAIALDPSTSEGETALANLVPGLDVLLEDFAPSAPEQALVTAWATMQAHKFFVLIHTKLMPAPQTKAASTSGTAATARATPARLPPPPDAAASRTASP